MTKKKNIKPSCAACTDQRRRCSPNCPLAPFFPASDQRKFLNVQRLFGIPNVINTLTNYCPTNDAKEDAMTAIIFEAEMRARSPVYGCYGIVNHYRDLILLMENELRNVTEQLDICKRQSNFEFGSSSSSNQFGEFDLTRISPNLVNLGNETNYGIWELGTNPCLSVQDQIDTLGLQQQDREWMYQDYENNMLRSSVLSQMEEEEHNNNLRILIDQQFNDFNLTIDQEFNLNTAQQFNLDTVQQSNLDNDQQSSQMEEEEHNKNLRILIDQQFNDFNLSIDQEFNLNTAQQFNLDNDEQFNLNIDQQFILDNDQQSNLDNDEQFSLNIDQQFILDNDQQSNLDSDEQNPNL